MTSFARYYDEHRKLTNISMDYLETLITDSDNKEKIAELIYHRYYERYLKIFFYQSGEKAKYDGDIEKNVFNTEFKNGFLVMASCCLLMETLSAFIKGCDKTLGQGKDAFQTFFVKAKKYNNRLQIFSNKELYKFVRNGILHQGETYKKFKIRRTGNLYDEDGSTINATLFAYELKSFLKSYTDELKISRWDTEIWDNCRVKLRYIIINSKK